MTAHPVLDLLTAALRDAADRLGVPSAELDVEHVESRVWIDGCLECAEPAVTIDFADAAALPRADALSPLIEWLSPRAVPSAGPGVPPT